MNLMKKTALLTSVLVALSTGARAQHSAEAAQSVVSGVSRFDLSSNACYHRMQAVEDISEKGFKPWDDPWEALVANRGDDTILGVPAGEWNEAVIAEFHAALATCTEPEGMKSVWGDAFLERVRAGFPDYLRLARERIDQAARFKESSASSSGVSASCRNLVDYARSGIGPTSPGYDNSAFGKALTAYEDADYKFLDAKIDACAGLLKAVGSGSEGAREQIGQLASLQKQIATAWREEQARLVPLEQAATLARAETDAAAAEKTRRETEPTTMERIADYMVKVGTLGVMLCIATAAKKDRRFKSGYRPDWLPQKPVFIVLVSSAGLMLLGWLIG